MRKKITIVLLVLTLFLLSACASSQLKTYVCSDGSSVSDPANCPVKEQRTTGTVDTVQSTPAKTTTTSSPPANQQLTTAAKDLISKASKVNVISFNYYRSDDPTTQDSFLVSRTKMKRVLVNKLVYSSKEQYDAIYLDLVSQTAKAYCETQSTETCIDRTQVANVDFAKYKVTTPFEWLNMIENADVTGKSKQIDGRTGKEISFKSNGQSGMMFLDSFYGVPLEVTYNGITYEYQNTVVNINKETELVHQ